MAANWSLLDSHVFPVPESGCWIYMGYLNSSGYGIYEINHRPVRVHRLFYERVHGEIPEGLILRHKCDVRCCVNPMHLIPGTRFDNYQDALQRGRVKSTPIEKRCVKLTPEAVLEIRTSEESARAMARKYGVGHSSILKVRHRETWAHIDQVRQS